MRNRANLSDIASEVGVSVMTVSNAISGKGRVSPGVAEQILKTAERLGYRPSQAGRALRTGRSKVLGLVLADIANPLFPQIAQAIEQAATGLGYGVLIGDSRGDPAMQKEAIDRLIHLGADGLIVVPRRGTTIEDIDCPVAIIDSPATPGNTVSSDHRDGGRQIGQHLLSLGHRHITIVGGDPASTVQNERVSGIISAIKNEAGFDLVRQEDGNPPTVDWRLRIEDGTTAIAAVTDLLALQVMTELQRLGFALPGDVSVTGFDDLPWARVVSPGITTMRQDLSAIANTAVRHLIADLDGHKPIGGTAGVTTPMQLVERGSTESPTSQFKRFNQERKTS